MKENIFLLLTIDKESLLCALRYLTGIISWIAFFKVLGYKRALKKHIKRDVEARNMQSQVFDAQAKDGEAR